MVTPCTPAVEPFSTHLSLFAHHIYCLALHTSYGHCLSYLFHIGCSLLARFARHTLYSGAIARSHQRSIAGSTCPLIHQAPKRLSAVVVQVLSVEVVIDIIKHAVLGKFNDIRPGMYREFMKVRVCSTRNGAVGP
jgi:hypothetical protein